SPLSPLAGRGVGGEGTRRQPSQAVLFPPVGFVIMSRNKRLTAFARQLRRDLTPAEKILWKYLRDRRFVNLKFRRQYPIGEYILDFFCPRFGVVVEIDGETHLGRAQADQTRDRWLEALGCKVLRIWNTDVYEDLDTVQEAIWQTCNERQQKGCRRSGQGWVFALHPPRPLPSPASPRGGTAKSYTT